MPWRKEGGRRQRWKEKKERDFYIPTIQNGNSENNSIDDSTKNNKILRNKLNQGSEVYILKILPKEIREA